MKLAILAIARNEAAFMPSWVREAKAIADDVWVADNGSTDGTGDLAREGGAKVVDIPFRFLLEHGFGATRTLLLRSIPTTVDRLHWLDIDERLPTGAEKVIRELGGPAPRFVQTRTPAPLKDFDIERWRSFLGGNLRSEWHIRSHPHRREFAWQGYIHEELCVEDRLANRIAVPSGVVHWHFTNQKKPATPPKELLYGFMIDRAVRIPELRKWTNSYWYRTYAPSIPHAELAATFRELCPEARDL